MQSPLKNLEKFSSPILCALADQSKERHRIEPPVTTNGLSRHLSTAMPNGMLAIANPKINNETVADTWGKLVAK